MEKYKDLKNRDGSRVIGGLIIVAVGAALLLRNTGFAMPHWLFTWPMILILVGVYTGFKHNFRHSSWLILIAIGTFFLIRKFMPELGLQPYFWPAVIIAAGVIFMLRPRWDNQTNWSFEKNNDAWEANAKQSWQANPNDTATPALAPANIEATDLLFVRSVFSGVKRSVVSKNFQGGKISAVFGGAEVDLSQADLRGPVVLRFEVLFGGAKIIVPSHWAIQNEIDGVFHGVDDNRRFNPSVALNPEKVLILKGSATFGGVDIRSYS